MSDAEIVKDFLIESYENLDRLDRDLVGLEKNPRDREALAGVFRTIHTIKGTCGFLGFSKLEKVAHVGENLLTRLRDGQLTLNPELTTALLSMVDAVRQMLKEIESTGSDGQPPSRRQAHPPKPRSQPATKALPNACGKGGDTCQRMKQAGYMIALDDFTVNDPREPLTDLADIIKVDLRATAPADAAAMVHKYGPWRVLEQNIAGAIDERAAPVTEHVETNQHGSVQGAARSRVHVLATEKILDPITEQEFITEHGLFRGKNRLPGHELGSRFEGRFLFAGAESGGSGGHLLFIGAKSREIRCE